MSQTARVISWTPAKLDLFKLAYAKAYGQAADKKQDVFEFDGDDFVLSYAKFLIEYLEMAMGRVR